MKEKTIIIVGGGQAAAMAAASLRQQGFTGELHLFSDERHLPYERPPLSKSMLLEDSPQLQQVLPANWWQENNVHLHSGVYSAAIFLIPICISFDTDEKRR